MSDATTPTADTPTDSGFGTFDEMFELLTLIQTGKVHKMPILVFGKEEFWDKVMDLEALALEGTIDLTINDFAF